MSTDSVLSSLMTLYMCVIIHKYIYDSREPRWEFLYGPVVFSLKMCCTVFTCLVTGHYVNYILLYIVCTNFVYYRSFFFFCHGYFQSVVQASMDARSKKLYIGSWYALLVLDNIIKTYLFKVLIRIREIYP